MSKYLIYQYWDGAPRSGTAASVKAIKKYAADIGVDYLFEDNPGWVKNLGTYSPHYGQFKCVYSDETFGEYDNILFLDCDVFPIDGLKESIFDGVSSDIGICTEDYQIINRPLTKGGQINGAWDEKWAEAMHLRWKVQMPRTPEGLLKVYNSGVVLYSRSGINKIRQSFSRFNEYVDYVSSCKLPRFYQSDQNYLHAMMFINHLNVTEMDSGWNSFVHYVGDASLNPRPINDTRTKSTKFVHIQLRCADDFDEQKLWRITNLPVSDWCL